VDAKPADMATVYTTMSKCKQMTLALGQPCSIQTFDQQLYAVAQQVKWHLSKDFESHVNRLGGFHTMCCFIASIGKLWGDGGLRDLLVDADVYAACTLDQMLAGKQFNRAVRALTLSYEALMHLYLQHFVEWCEVKGHTMPTVVWETLVNAQAAVKDGVRNQSVRTVTELENAIFEHMTPLLAQYKDWGCSKSPTFQYWYMFFEAVQLMLLNIRAEREGNWKLHLHTQSTMLPYMFSASEPTIHDGCLATYWIW
jgi:hypothetical protein